MSLDGQGVLDLFSKEIFASRLHALRTDRKLSSVQLAKDIGVSKQAISQFEKCANYPHVNTLVLISDYFNVSLDYLAGRTDDPKGGVI